MIREIDEGIGFVVPQHDVVGRSIFFDQALLEQQRLGFAVGDGDPDLLDPNCDATRVDGAAWDFTSITLSITSCTVGVEESSWGAIKSLYAD